MKSRSLYTLFALASLGSVPVLAQGTTPPKAAKAAKPDPPKEIALDGELRLDGKITVFLGPGQWMVESVSWTSPKGVLTNFEEPKTKTVTLNADAFIHPHGEFTKVPLSDIPIGTRVAIIGKNQPDGTVKVREVVLLEGFGARKKIGVLGINLQSKILIDQSRAAREAGQIAKAIDLAKRAKEIAQGAGDTSGEALSSQDLGNLYLDDEQIDLAMQTFTREETLGNALSNPLVITFGKFGRARVLAGSGETDDAIKVLQEAVPYSQNTPGSLQINVLSLLSRVYMTAGQISEAVGVMEKLWPLEAANGESDDSYETRVTIALLRVVEEPDAARAILDQIAPNIQNIGDDTTRATVIGTSAIVLWRLGEKETAQEQLQKAIKTLNDAGKKGADRWEAISKRLTDAGDKEIDPLEILKGPKGEGDKATPDAT